MPTGSGETAATLKADRVEPGQLSFFDVSLKAPSAKGNYVAKFSLAVSGEPIDGGAVEVPIEVYAFSATPDADSTAAGNFGTTYEPELSAFGPKGPNLRIGLFTTTEPVVLTAAGAYTLIDGDDQMVRDLSGTTTVTFDFATRTYTVRTAAIPTPPTSMSTSGPSIQRRRSSRS